VNVPRLDHSLTDANGVWAHEAGAAVQRLDSGLGQTLF
jgi:hypothetical protein